MNTSDGKAGHNVKSTIATDNATSSQVNGQVTLPSSLPTPTVKGYLFGQLAGKGTYGYVFRANKLDTKQLVAIKCVLLSKLSKSTRDNVINEIAILKILKHKFIVQMLDFQWDRNFIYLIFEYCDGGELATVLRLKRCFAEEIVQHFLQQLTSALQFMRANNISHMDLKPQNILIAGISFVNLLQQLNKFQVWRNVVLKIADFGFAQHLSDQELASSFRGSPLYMAPEIIYGQKYDARVDLWSIGIIMYQCLFGFTPYQCSSTEELIKKFQSNQIKITIPHSKPKISTNCRDLLKRLLKFDPTMRISFEAFFAHPFLDLEHIPTTESYGKAMQILKVAINEDKKGNYKYAFYQYREALMYLMPIYKWGDLSKPYDPKYQDNLKARLVKYIERAERLQQQCGLTKVDQVTLALIQEVFNLIDSARDLRDRQLFDSSLHQYQEAIGKALEIIKKTDAAVRLEFFGDINVWMTEAEQVKAKLCAQNSSSVNANNSFQQSKSQSLKKSSGFDHSKSEQYRGNSLDCTMSLNSNISLGPQSNVSVNPPMKQTTTKKEQSRWWQFGETYSADNSSMHNSHSHSDDYESTTHQRFSLAEGPKECCIQ